MTQQVACKQWSPGGVCLACRAPQGRLEGPVKGSSSGSGGWLLAGADKATLMDQRSDSLHKAPSPSGKTRRLPLARKEKGDSARPPLPIPPQGQVPGQHAASSLKERRLGVGSCLEGKICRRQGGPPFLACYSPIRASLPSCGNLVLSWRAAPLQATTTEMLGLRAKLPPPLEM